MLGDSWRCQLAGEYISQIKVIGTFQVIFYFPPSVTLHLNAWLDGGCPIIYFVVEYKPKNQKDWSVVSNNVKPGGNFVVLDLNPATWYNLRVTAHNNAGFSIAEYEFATLTATGGMKHVCANNIDGNS